MSIMYCAHKGTYLAFEKMVREGGYGNAFSLFTALSANDIEPYSKNVRDTWLREEIATAPHGSVRLHRAILTIAIRHFSTTDRYKAMIPSYCRMLPKTPIRLSSNTTVRPGPNLDLVIIRQTKEKK